MRNLRATKEATPNSTILSPPKTTRPSDDGFPVRGELSGLSFPLNSQFDSRQPSIAFNKSELYKLFMTCKGAKAPSSMTALASILSSGLMETSLKEFLTANPEIFQRHFEFVFFSYVFGPKNDLIGYKYRPLFTENLCSSPFIATFQKSLLEFFEEKYDENSLGRLSGYKNSAGLKSNLGGNSRPKRTRYDDFTDSDIEEVQRKWGIVVNGDGGCGKYSSIQAFINTFGFEVENIDLSSSEKIKSFMNQFASAVTMNDVKISLNNIEETSRDTDSFFYNSSKTQKGTFSQSKLDSRSISKFNPIQGLTQNTKTAGKRRSAKEEVVLEISDDDKLVTKTPKNTLASFFKKTDTPTPQIKPGQNSKECSIQNLGTTKKSDRNNARMSEKAHVDLSKPPSRKNKKDTSSVSKLTEEAIIFDQDHLSNRQNTYKPAMFDQDSKNFSSNKGLYWNTRKIYLCRNIELFYTNEFILDRKKCFKKIEEFCLMLEKSNYPFVFIQQATFNEVFHQVLSHFDVLSKQSYSKNEIDLLVFVVLFFEINFGEFAQDKMALKEGQLMENGLTHQIVYDETLRLFEDSYQFLSLEVPIWQKVVYVNNLLNYNLVKIFSFAELQKDLYTKREWLAGIDSRLLSANSADYLAVGDSIYFNHKVHLASELESTITIQSPCKPKNSSRLKKISKIKSDKKSKRGNRDESETEENDLAGQTKPQEVVIKVDLGFETDPLFNSTLFNYTTLLKASWSLRTDPLFAFNETAMLDEDDQDINSLKAIDLKLARTSASDRFHRASRQLFVETHNPVNPLDHQKDISEYIAIASKIKARVTNQTAAFNKFSEDWSLDTRLGFVEIEKLKLFAQMPDESFNTTFKTRTQRRQMRELRQGDPGKTPMLIDKFTTDQGQLALLKSYFPYF
jgi:hypothetical protein